MGVGGGMRRGSGIGGDGVGSDNYLKLLSQNKNWLKHEQTPTSKNNILTW